MKKKIVGIAILLAIVAAGAALVIGLAGGGKSEPKVYTAEQARDTFVAFFNPQLQAQGAAIASAACVQVKLTRAGKVVEDKSGTSTTYSCVLAIVPVGAAGAGSECVGVAFKLLAGSKEPEVLGAQGIDPRNCQA